MNNNNNNNNNNNANNNFDSMRCWICMNFIIDYMLLPYEDEYLGHDVGIFKNTMIIKDFNDLVQIFQNFHFYILHVVINVLTLI